MTTFTWSLAGTDAGDFTITDGELKFANTPDYEMPADSNRDSEYLVTVRAYDGTNYGTLDATVTVTDVNEAPTVTGTTSRDYAENLTDSVATYTAVDPEGITFTWSLAGTDAGEFTITDGELKFANTPDYEMPADSNRDSEYLVTVRAYDGTNYGTLDATVTVTDVNEAPTVTGTTSRDYAENLTDSVATYSATDPEGITFTWSLAGTDAGDFTITDGELKFANTPDYEMPADSNRDSEYLVTVRAYDGTNYGTLDATVTVTDVNEAPTVTGTTSRDYAENLTDSVATYSATDPEGITVTWSLAGTDAGDFTITDGELKFANTPDYEMPADSNRDSEYLVTVRAYDGTNYGTLDVTVTVTDVDETGSVALSSVRPQEDTALTATLTDADGSITGITWEWHRSPNGTSNWTEVTGFGPCLSGSCSYTPVADDVGDFLRARVSYTDGHDSNKAAERVSDNPVQAKPVANRPPTFPSSETGARSVEENTVSGVDFGDPVEATDPDNDDLTYTLGGTDKDSFEIAASTGQLSTKADLDREIKSTYRVTVTAADPSQLKAQQNVTITVTDVNEAPVISGLAGVDYPENRTAVITRYTATDPERNTITWDLSGADQDDLDISSTGQLSFQSTPDYEAPTDQDGNNTYQITVEAFDGTNTTTQPVEIIVTGVNEPPVISGPNTIDDHPEDTSTFVASYVISDPEGTTTATTLTGTDRDDLQITNTGPAQFPGNPRL